jgi:predicted O-linked N-acetylglucosamine transferase (SPINDLY family)
MATMAEALARAVQGYMSGNLAGAEQICQQVLEANPAQADALNLLGLVAQRAGQPQAAVAYLRHALALRPQAADFHSNLAFVYRTLGQWDDALGCYREALRLAPQVPELHCNLGAALAERGQLAEAQACFEAALWLRPSLAEAHQQLAKVLKRLGRLAEAETSLQETVRLRPAEKTYLELGNLQLQTGQVRAAEASYREALRRAPASADALCNLGSVLTEQERFAEAEGCYREALRLAPDYVETHYNLGLNFAAQAKPDEALACYEHAVRIKPDFVDGLYRLGIAYYNRGLLDEAVAHFRKALALRPNDRVIQSSLLLSTHYFADYDPEASFAEHVAWGKQFSFSREPPASADALAGGSRLNEAAACPPVDRDPVRRLRIGYVSGDFWEHVMGRYSEAVIAAHDRSQFEVFSYANARKADARTQRIKAAADHWRVVAGQDDARVADRIREDRIDLLIDLAGHTGNNRLGVFALKPAAVQVTHCGYPGGTGLGAIDYRLTDPYCDPPGQTERWHVEEVVRLPEAHWCYAPPPTPDVGPLPAQEPGAVAFGSFNIPAKITETMIRLWAEILHALPRSRMLVQTGAGRAGDERVLAAFARHGIEPPRVRLLEKLRAELYYRMFQEIDICLDTYPYTGCNTTADALWMGVPVVTWAGPSCVTRLGVSAIVLAGLEDLVTDSPAAFVETVVRLANDLPRLRELRAQLRGRVQRTLGNVERFTRQLETAYRKMWRAYCEAAGE